MKAANLNPDDPLVRTAVFGEQVQEFLRGDIGSYLIERIERKVQEIEHQLHTCDFATVQDFKLHQARLAMYEGLQAWLGDAVAEGIRATQTLDGEEDIDG
jgi:hypothetical protein